MCLFVCLFVQNSTIYRSAGGAKKKICAKSIKYTMLLLFVTVFVLPNYARRNRRRTKKTKKKKQLERKWHKQQITVNERNTIKENTTRNVLYVAHCSRQQNGKHMYILVVEFSKKLKICSINLPVKWTPDHRCRWCSFSVDAQLTKMIQRWCTPYALVAHAFLSRNDQPNWWQQREHRWANRTTL